MIKQILFWLMFFCVWPEMLSQENAITRLNKAKSEIDSLFEAENYLVLKPKVESQLRWIKSNNLMDSLYAYAYISGRTYWKVKSAAEGTSKAESIISEIAKNDRDYHHLLSALTDLSWLYYETGNDSMCMRTDQRYVSECLLIKGIEADLLARGYYNLGFDFLSIGNALKAIENFESSIQTLSMDQEDHDGLLLKLFNAQGSAMYRLGNFNGAIASYDKSLELAQRSEDEYDKNSNMANSYGNLSLIYKDISDFVNAKGMLEKSMYHRNLAMIATSEPNLKQQEQDNLTKAYTNLAGIYLKIGEFEITEKLLIKAKSEKEKVLEPTDPRLNFINESFGSLYLAQSKFDAALECLQRYKSSCLAHYGELSFWTGIACHDVAKAYNGLKKYFEAEVAYSDAIRIFEAIGDEENNQDLASTYLDRSEVNMKLMDNESALNDVRSAMNIYKQTRDSTDAVFAMCLLMESDILLRKHQFDFAEQRVKRAIDILESGRSLARNQEEHLKYLNPYLPEAYRKMASIVSSKDSSVKSIKSGLDYIDLAVKSMASAQVTLSKNSAVLDLYAENEALFNDGLEMSEELFRMTGEKSYAEKMLELGEQSKTLMLRRRLNDFSSIIFSNIPDSLVFKEHDLAKELGELYEDSPGLLLQKEREFHSCMQSLKSEYPKYYDLKYKTDVASISQVQSQLLKVGQNFLEYFLTDSSLFALIVQPDAYHVVNLSMTETIESIRLYNRAILQRDESVISDLSYRLYALLFQPLEDFFIGDEIIVVPDNQLFQINFESLRNQQGGDIQSSLIFKYTFSYLLSATSGLQFNQLKQSNTDGILAFAPGFSDEQKTWYNSGIGGHNIFKEKFLSYIQQPFAVKTAQNITSIIPGVSFTANNATETNFRMNASEYGVIHFGTHTEINNTSPLMSRLILCASDSTNQGDGFLHAYEIYSLELKAELVVLSACETGYGQPDNSEGVLSLAHSFAYAGCPSVVMSSWQIDEKTTSEIVESFYRYLAEGDPKNVALRKAKLEFMQNHPGELCSPYYWAGLVLIGDIDPLSSATSHSQLWAIVFFVLVIALFFILFFKFKARRRSLK